MYKIILNNEISFIKQVGSLIVLILFIIPNYSFSESFKFPKKIKYKIQMGEKIVGETVFNYSTKAEMHQVSFKYHDDSYYATLNNDYQFEYLIQINNKRVISEFILKGNSSDNGYISNNGSFLGGSLLSFRVNNSKPKIIEILTNEKIMDTYSSFLLLSRKMDSEKKKIEEKFFFIIYNKLYTVNCKYMGHERYNYIGNNIYVTKYQLQRVLHHNFLNIAEFYIYKNTKGYCFPVKIIFNSEDNYTLRAARVLK